KRRNLRQGRIRRSFKSVVQQTGINLSTSLHLLVIIPVDFTDRFLTRNMRVTDTQRTTRAISGLRNVTVNNILHSVSVVGLNPPLGLVHNHERWTFTFESKRRACNTLDHLTSTVVNDRLV